MGEAMGWLGWICFNWYNGERENVSVDLVTGVRRPNIVGEEAHAAWELANMIGRSPELRSLLEIYPDERFFDFLDQCIDGPTFREKYEKYVTERGHRGHPDRDIYFDRRADNVMVDLIPWQGMLDEPDPRPAEPETRQRLEDSIKHVHDNLAAQDNGTWKAFLFDTLVDFTHRSLEYRDNEREVMDWSTYDIKICFEEVGRRCVERGRLAEVKECYFLTMEEALRCPRRARQPADDPGQGRCPPQELRRDQHRRARPGAVHPAQPSVRDRRAGDHRRGRPAGQADQRRPGHRCRSGGPRTEPDRSDQPRGHSRGARHGSRVDAGLRPDQGHCSGEWRPDQPRRDHRA